jgi:hypothetical protein
VRQRLFVHAAVVLATAIAILVLVPRNRPLGPGEAIAVIPAMQGMAEGAPVWGPVGPAPIARVERVRRRGNDLVLRLRFRDSTIARRRGDALRVWSAGRGRQLAFVPGPTYEKPGYVSDTLVLQTPASRRPATVEELLSGLYRGRPTLDSPPR